MSPKAVFLTSKCRGSCQELFFKFGNFTRIHLCWSLFFNKVTGLGPAALFKKRLRHRCFPVNFAKFLRTTFFKEHLQRLLLKMSVKNETLILETTKMWRWQLSIVLHCLSQRLPVETLLKTVFILARDLVFFFDFKTKEI